MKVKLYGTRGSIAISRPDSVQVGGNTTSLRLSSPCIPDGWAMGVDGGTGYYQLSHDLLNESIMHLSMLFTHWHDDHLEGVKMAPHTFHPKARIKAWGPVEHSKGPREIFQSLMQEPRFPMNFQKVQHRFTCEELAHVGVKVMVVHPKGGFNLLPVHIFRDAEENGKQVTLGRNGKFFISECLVVWMYKTKHPEYTISFRFEERPTGRVFVFLTDHENTDGIPMDLRAHVRDAHLIILDCQYSREDYNQRTAGFGHATPDYCAQLAIAGNVYRAGITHHDPHATDENVFQRLSEFQEALRKGDADALALRSFACKDYDEYDV